MGRRRQGRVPLASPAAWILFLILPLTPLLLALPALAGTTGKLSGRVVDQAKQPLPGVTVLITGTRTGAMTDAQGLYSVINVPAGTYDVRFILLGYRAVVVTGVVVSADKTTRLDQQLGESPVALAEVVVSGKAPVVDVRQTSNIATVSRDVIAQLPVQELQDVVNLQAGVVDGHFRGGRIGEVQFQVDGISVNNAYDNSSTLRIDRSLLEEVQVISGTFDAEYGQAMSGVVNAVLKRGSDRFEWNAESYGGGFLFPRSGSREVPLIGGAAQSPVMDAGFHPAGTYSLQGSLTGPVGNAAATQTRFLLSGRYSHEDDWVRGIRKFRPTDRPDLNSLDPLGTGGGANVPLGYSRGWSGVGKITNTSLHNIELGYQAIVNVENGRRADWAFHLNPDGLSKQHTYSIVHGIDWTQTLSKKTFYTLALRQNYFNYLDRLADFWSPLYDAAGSPLGQANYADGAFVQGVALTQFLQNTNAILFKGSVVDQVTPDNQVKAGGEFQLPRLEFGNLGVLAQQGNGPMKRFYAVPLVYYPVLGAGYAQDQLEWNDLTFRAGMRLDYFNARSSVPGDPHDPANVLDAVYVPPQATTAKVSISPRLGVSYPISPRASLYFAYGHFYQMPGLGDIFTNADYSILSNLSAGGVSFGVMGNPDIKPEKTVAYQGGYKNAISDDLGVSLDVFYKDIRDLLGVEFVQTYNVAEYARLTNVDFGGVLGFTLAFDLRPHGLLSGSLDYTWQQAKGNSSDPRETATRAEAGEDPRPRQVPLNWDQRHTLNVTATLARPQKFSASGILRVASGQPYTPTVQRGFAGGLESNSGRKPMGALLDLRAEKPFRAAGGQSFSIFARVFNVFDAKFWNGFVFGDTGSPYYSRNPIADRGQLDNPTRLYTPRRIEVGISAGGTP